jgi:hypothetical protein
MIDSYRKFNVLFKNEYKKDLKEEVFFKSIFEKNLIILLRALALHLKIENTSFLVFIIQIILQYTNVQVFWIIFLYFKFLSVFKSVLTH